MMAKVKDVLGVVGDTTKDYASRVSGTTSALARRVGPKRGGIALGVLAVAIGTPFVIRYLRARRADRELNEYGYEFDETATQGRRRRVRGTPRAGAPIVTG